MGLFTRLAETVVGSNAVNPGWLRTWMTEVERLFTSAVYAERIYGTLADLDADPAHDANSGAIVMGDSAANDGVYRKIGVSGSGEWIRVGDLPGRGFVVASDGGGTANAIEAVTALPVNGSELITVPIVQTNTAAGPTVSFNGGPALAIATSAGNPVFENGLPAGSEITGRIDGSVFRLLSDQAAAAIQAASEAAAVEALGYRNDAQQAAADAATTAGQAVFANRNATNAAICAGFTDNTRCRMGDLDYVVDSTATGTASATNDLGVDGLRPAGIATVDHFGPDSGASARALVAVDYVETRAGGNYSLAATLIIPLGKKFVHVADSVVGVDAGFSDNMAIDISGGGEYLQYGIADGSNLPVPASDWVGVDHPVGVWVSGVGTSGAYVDNPRWPGKGTVRNCPSGACWFKYWRDPVIGDHTAIDCQSHTAHAVNAVFDFFIGEGGTWGDIFIDGWRLKGLEIDNAVSAVATGTVRGKRGTNTGFCTLAFGSGSENSGFTGTVLLEGGAGNGTAMKLELGSSWVFATVIARSPSHAAVILQSVDGCDGELVRVVEGFGQAVYIQSIDGQASVSDVKISKIVSRRGVAPVSSNQTALVVRADSDSFPVNGIDVESISSFNDWTGVHLTSEGTIDNVFFGLVRIEGNANYAFIAYARRLTIAKLILRPTASSGTAAQCYFAVRGTVANAVLRIDGMDYDNVNAADDVIQFDSLSSWDAVSIQGVHGIGGNHVIRVIASTKIRKLTLRDIMGLDMAQPAAIRISVDTTDTYIDARDIWLTNGGTPFNIQFDEANGGEFFGVVPDAMNCGIALNGVTGRPAGVVT